MKFRTTSDLGKPPKKKAKRNNIRWDAIYANKISFRFIDKLLSTFPRFFNEIDTSQSPGHPGVPRSYTCKPGMKYISGNPGHPGTLRSYKQALYN